MRPSSRARGFFEARAWRLLKNLSSFGIDHHRHSGNPSLLGVVEKADMRPPRRSLFTDKNIKSTPPLRGSGFPLGKPDRSRAFFAKADAVGGGLLCGMSPHRFGFGFIPSPHRLPLKGGVKPLLSSLGAMHRITESGLFHLFLPAQDDRNHLPQADRLHLLRDGVALLARMDDEGALGPYVLARVVKALAEPC